ncbi:MAG TPA: 3-deoxy-manno-octulosonate cytidylyltransferase [Candidatus Cloacimonadota bacterium]|nr:3-deoxy-manno-octulosonate cytidylyltransferase [Candidatus Cloacimonadota bacterium]
MDSEKCKKEQKVVAIIPARYDSTRFPGKMLAKLGTKPIIQHVYERAVQTGIFSEVVVGTDDQRIFEAIDQFGGKVLLTGRKHQSGTDRIAEVCEKLPCCQEAEIVVNIQGDEPFITAEPLCRLVGAFQDEKVQVASLMYHLKKEVENPNSVKVVCDQDNFSLYFSRSVIPFDRDKKSEIRPQYFKHIGVYAFRREMLFRFVEMPKGRLEEIEKLEQLRLLENGIRLKMIETEYEGIGIDTPEDLEKAKKLLERLTTNKN